jgi:gas vesicle protein
VAIFHLSTKMISRSAGRSATGSAAYRSGREITDERTGKTFDYTRKRGVEHSEVLAPDNAPEWVHDHSALWNAVEKVEKRKDAQLSREVEISLPRELTREQQVDLVRGYVREQFVSRGMVADVSIHAPHASDGLEQAHAHVMLTTRQIGPDGFGKKDRTWNDRGNVDVWREKWAEHANRALERAGHELRIDHRSLKAQYDKAMEVVQDEARPMPERLEAVEKSWQLKDREPQPKLGPTAAAMERRGIKTERGDMLRGVQQRNQLRERLLEVLRDMQRKLWEIGHKIKLEASERLRGATEHHIAPAMPRYDQMSVGQLEAEIARVRPAPLETAVEARPEMREIARERSVLAGRLEKTRLQREKVSQDVAAWQKKHPIRTFLIDPKYRNEKVDAVDRRIDALEQQLKDFDRDHVGQIKAIRQQVMDEQAPARKKAKEIGKILDQKRVAQVQRSQLERTFQDIAFRMEKHLNFGQSRYDQSPRDMQQALTKYNSLPTEKDRKVMLSKIPERTLNDWNKHHRTLERSRGMDLGL